MNIRIGLGTAQFGLDYGVSNFCKVTESEVIRILGMARDFGIEVIDTAVGYGRQS